MSGELIIPIGTEGTKSVKIDFSSVSHMLIGGTTGSGKTAFIQSVMAQLMRLYSPNDLGFIIYDSKGIDYNYLKDNPFLFLEVINNSPRAQGTLNWLVLEAGRRQKQFQEIHKEKNLYLILDDYSALAQQSDIQKVLCNLLQLGRSVKIHCILVTSMPTKRVIPLELEANIPYRVAFHSATKALSERLIGMSGAEALMPGEMIFSGDGKPVKLKAVHINYEEATRINNETIDIWRAQLASFDDSIYEQIEAALNTGNVSHEEESTDRDAYFVEAGRLIIERKRASIGMLQRRFKIGFNRACRIMDQLCDAGVVGEEEGMQPRRVLMTQEEFELLIKVDA